LQVDVQKMVYLSLLLTLALCLHVVESWVGAALPVPGAKLGLANLVTVVVLWLYGLKPALVITAVRQIAGSLLAGTFLGTGFWMGLIAGLVSSIIMWAAMRYGQQWLSMVGVSILGAAAHNTGQLLVAAIIIGNCSVFSWLSYLLPASIITGSVTGLTAVFLIGSLCQLPVSKGRCCWQERALSVSVKQR